MKTMNKNGKWYIISGIVLIALIASFMILLNINKYSEINIIDKQDRIIRSSYDKAITFQPENISGLKYPDLVIKNGANLIVRLRLVENTENCIKNCYAIINITNTISGSLPNVFDFQDKKNNSRKTLPFQVYYLKNYTTVSRTFEQRNYTCINGGNCTYFNSYNVTETRKEPNWLPYNGETFAVGNHTIKLVGTKEKDDVIDWSFSYNGFASDEIRQYWAVWNASFTSGLSEYWSFNETSGTLAQDSINPALNLTRHINWTFANGKNAYGLNVSPQYRDTVTTGVNFNARSAITFNYWMYRTGSLSDGTSTGTIIANTNNANSAGKFVFTANNCGDQNTQMGVDLTDSSSRKGLGNCVTVPLGQWTMITLIINNTDTLYYYNGTLVKNFTLSNFAFSTDSVRLFSDGSGTAKFHGALIDEMAIWNRSLSAAEISDLWNNGTGIFYSNETPSSDTDYPKFSDITITPTSPQVYAIRDYQFNTTITSTNGTAGIEFNGTNYTMTNYTNNFTKVLSNLTFGNYSYFFWAYGNGTSTLFNKTTTSYYFVSPAQVLINFVNQTPADITSSNLDNISLIIQYNITATSSSASLNTSSIELFWLTNGTSHKNFTFYVNGTNLVTGFRTFGVIKVNSSSIFNFTLSDTIYPTTYLLNASTLENTVHQNFSLASDNDLIKALVLNMTNASQYNVLEFMIANQTPTVASLRIYYCNSTYTTGSVATSPNCNQFGNVLNTQGINHVENNSRHTIVSVPINTTSGTIGGVKVTNTGYFVWRGRTEGWNASYVPIVTRTSAIQTSANTGTTWSDLSGTLDYYLRQFDVDDTFRYYVCANDTLGNYNCSTIRIDTMNNTDLPPSSPTIISPTAGTYNGTILINYTASISPNGYNISYYNISLYNSDDTFNMTIRANNSLNLTYLWNSTASIISGTFNIHVWATDIFGKAALAESEDFSISNTGNTTTTVTTNPSSPITYYTSSTFDCNNDGGLNTDLFINGVNKTSEKGVAIVRKVGTYTVNCTSYDNPSIGKFGSSQQISYVINKYTDQLLISISPSNRVTYPTETTITGSSCDSQLTCTLYEDGIEVSNPYVVTNVVGIKTYNYTTLGNENITGSSNVTNLTVEKGQPTTTLTILPGTTVSNGTQTTATCSVDVGIPVLERDSVVVANPETTTFGLGNYEYNCSVAPTANYNGSSTVSTLSVIPASTGGLNGSIEFNASSLNTTLTFLVPYRFLTNAYMNLSGLASTCYQESANVSNQSGTDGDCNQNYSGNYIITNWTDGSKLIDGDFGTSTIELSGQARFEVNYTKPINAVGAIWKVKTSVDTVNLTIPSDCWNANSTSLHLMFNSTIITPIRMYCNNGTTYNELNNSGISTDTFEEGIYWQYYPTNVNLFLGSSTIFNYPLLFNQTNNRTSNFYNIINQYLPTCTFSGGFCSVPISFNSSTSGLLGYSDIVLNNSGFIENSQTYNPNVYETSRQNFTINISYDNSSFTPQASFVYNGTSYTATSTLFGSNASFNYSLDIPLINSTQNRSWYWNISLTNTTGSTSYYRSTTKSHQVAPFNISLCGASPLNVPYINYTFKNETIGAESISATFSININAWLGNGSVNKTFSFTNGTANPSYAFCFSPSNQSYFASTSGTYSNAYSQQRSFSNSSMILTNSSTNVELLLLPNSDGIYITFIVQSNTLSRINGATIAITKTSDGTPVETKSTDGTGIAAFWLSTSTSYNIIASASGYNSYATSITPSTSPVTITLFSSAGSESGSRPNPVRGINIGISPTDIQLNNNTDYTFYFNITSYGSRLQSYGFSLWNKTTALTSSITGTNSRGELLSLIYNTDNQEYIIMKYYYTIGGNITNGSTIWVVSDPGGSGFSIRNALNRANGYMNDTTDSDGIFGLKSDGEKGSFGIAIIIFLITIFVTGVMSYKYGLTSTTAITAMMFSVIMFFDVGANLIPSPMPNAVPHFATIFMGAILFIMFVREAFN